MRLNFTLLLAFLSYSLVAQTTADFENISLENESFLNGSDLSGGFSAGNIFLPNSYNVGYSSWSGWAISNTTDVTTPGFMNQYSSITGSGYENSATYAVSFVSGGSIIRLENEAKGKAVEGMYVTNNTYAYFSMKDGDMFAKKFGGATENDEDFYFITIKKYENGELSTDSIDFYMADYRFADNTQDYIINEWTYIDLTSLGNADSLVITRSSSDIGNYGVNTPSYVCIDNFTTKDELVSTLALEAANFSVFPNPVSSYMIIELEDSNKGLYSIYDVNGRKIMTNRAVISGDRVDLSALSTGLYYIQLSTETGTSSRTFLKE